MNAEQLAEDLLSRIDALEDTITERVTQSIRIELAQQELGDDYMLTEGEAAQLLGVHRETLAKKRRAGEIRAGKIGKSPRYSIGKLRRMLRSVADRA